jgi:hypothetical protein
VKTVNVFQSMGKTFSLGWERDDVKDVIHVIAQAEPGAPILPTDGRGNPHWPCQTCEAHGYTPDLFYAQIEDALKRGPNKHL